MIANKIRKICEERSGTMAVPIIVFLLIAVIIILFAMDIFNAMMKYQNVNYSAKSIAKIIECEGAVTDRAYNHMAELNKNFDMDMTFEVSDVTYFDSRVKSIQFRDSFKVTVKYTCGIKLASPVFSAPIIWNIDMEANVPGMSEVYWK